MTGILPAIVLLLIASIGHGSVVVALYNRINATGLPRTRIKLIEKGILAAGLVIPFGLMLLEYLGGNRTLSGFLHMEAWRWPTVGYLLCCAMIALVGAPFWIESRPQFTIARDRFEVVEQNLWRPGPSDPGWIRGDAFSRMNRLPSNQIAWTEANRKRLYLCELPPALVGLKIAHLSDVHLTGQMSLPFYFRAIDWLMEAEPDMVILSGDIVDYQHALEDLPKVFERVRANLGCYFILGNHDRRLPDPLEVCAGLTQLGWHDLGHANHTIESLHLRLLGNELPWFFRNGNTPDAEMPNNLWTLGVAHSPDQFAWGVKMGCNLLLCGHTHGGQIRFPLVGPLVAPSWYGSRYASGVFQKDKTVMHVSRGLSGIHPFRWGCPPEVTLLELAHRAIES